MSLVLIPEFVVPGKRLGRHVDSRAVEYRAVNGPPPLSNVLRSVRHVSSPNMPLNQGDTSACTVHALTGNLNSVPHWANHAPGAPFLSQEQVWPIYSREEENLFGSPYPPTDEGGSGQAVCEAGEELGYVSGFNYAANIHEVLLSLVLRPGIAGINWYPTFDECDQSTGMLATPPTGQKPRGGHEISADELVVPAGVTVENMLDYLDEIQVWFWQSWGPGVFGLNLTGRFGMTAQLLATLMSQGGDFKVPRTAPGWVAPSAETSAQVALAPAQVEESPHSTPPEKSQEGSPQGTPPHDLPVVPLTDFTQGPRQHVVEAQKSTRTETITDPDEYRDQVFGAVDGPGGTMPAGPFPGV